MTGELLLTKAMSTALVLGFFALVIFFLRFLYGPKGVFRDPQWDRWNEEARLELAARLAGKDGTGGRNGKGGMNGESGKNDRDGAGEEAAPAGLPVLEEAFRSYIRRFFTGRDAEDLPLRVKEEHTRRVQAYASAIAAHEPALAGPELFRALRLAALFHDVARFPQYRRFHSFADDLSFNHGQEGARIILRQGFLAGEERPVRRLVLCAVAMHNRKKTPSGLTGGPRAVLDALRDADKLDVMRVLADALEPGGPADDVVLLHLKDEPGAWSAPVLEDLLNGRIAAYRDMRYYNDFRLLLCSWIYDLRYAETRRIAAREGHLERLIRGLSAIPEVRDEVAALVARELGG